MYYRAILLTLLALALAAGSASAAIPPAPTQAAGVAQGATTPQAQALSQGAAYAPSYSGPANPSVRPAAPGNTGGFNANTPAARADQARFLWRDDRWWYFTADNRWMVWGQSGWGFPQPSGNTVSHYGGSSANPQAQYNVPAPSGYNYAPGSSYYFYPGYGNYYPANTSRFSAGTGMFSGR